MDREVKPPSVNPHGVCWCGECTCIIYSVHAESRVKPLREALEKIAMNAGACPDLHFAQNLARRALADFNAEQEGTGEFAPDRSTEEPSG